MAKRYPHLEEQHLAFMARQHVFFAASAAPGSRVNLSPRGTDALRVLDERTVVYLDRTGSGNETAAHMLADGRLTLMLCAFEGPPLILRLYGRGRTLHRDGAEYAGLLADRFGGEEPLGARQMMHLTIELVQTSCGYGVPLFDYTGERTQMDRWAEAKMKDVGRETGETGIEAYWREKNQASMDGLPTGLLDHQGAVEEAAE